MEAGAGIEPAIKALQASALPLCYPAKKWRLFDNSEYKKQLNS